jgi:single-stranded DNA-binding protein
MTLEDEMAKGDNNKWQIEGYVFNDAEIKTSRDGSKSWGEVTVSVYSGSKLKPKKLWVRCTSFGDEKSALVSFAKKGAKVKVTGKLDADPYVSKKDGKPSPGLNLLVREFEVVEAPKAPGIGDGEFELPF